jgi:hypothetical protein
MSFSSEYEKLRKKRLKEAEESQKSTSKKSFSEEYNDARTKRLEAEDEIKSTVNVPTYGDLKRWQQENDRDLFPVLLRGDMNPTELGKSLETQLANAKKIVTPEKSTVFSAGAFDDGYQFGDVTKSVLATTADAAVSGVRGLGNFGEGVVDLFTYLLGEGADLVGWDGAAETLKDAANYQAVNEALGDVTFDDSLLGDKARTFAEVLGQVGGLVGTGGLGAAAGLSSLGVSALTTGTTFASSFGSGIGEAYQSDASDELAWKYGAFKGGIDAGTELMFGGLGKGFGALGLGKGLLAVDDALAKSLTKNISNVLLKNSIQMGVKGAAEGVEELAAGYLTALAQKGTIKTEEDLEKLIDDQNLLEQFVMGSLAGGVMSSVHLPKSVKSGRDYITGLTANEQTVVDTEVANRVAIAEQNGETVTKKQKSKIESQVLEDLKRGYISTDTIESALGGETFKSYQDALSNEDSILKEYEELGKKQNATLAEQARYAELQGMAKDIKDNSKSAQLRTQLSEEVQKSLTRDNNGKIQTDDFLLESYNEKARRGKAFEADVSQYDAKQQETIQKAIDSGILNDTRRTHDFVDMVAKISAEKGVLFDFTNNEKLKESGFAVDGKFVNGYVTKDGVTLNIESTKSLNSVVGHEITHVLEGTELYTELQNTLKEYATSKNEYKTRLDALKKLYEGVKDADAEAELTADLVGDYLFTDSEFITHLSTKNRNVFQKIYDEIKYLWKVATAGSTEARQLEKVKRAFDKAYRENVKDTKTDTKYSLTLNEAEVNEHRAKAVETFGTTTDFTEAGFALANGEMVKLTQKGLRDVQHRQIEQVFGDTDITGHKAINRFIAEGNVRIKASAPGIEISSTTPITNAQYKTIKDFINHTFRTKKYINVDITDVDGNNVGSLEYSVYDYEAKDIIYDIERYYRTGQIPKVNNASSSVYYSLSDSNGNKLSEGQQEYFKDSKVRDENGNLKVMYHGTSKGGHTVFDTFGESRFGLFGAGTYFTDNKDIAESYTEKGRGNNKQVYESYLNITNPIDMDAKADVDAWKNAFSDADYSNCVTNEDCFRAMKEVFVDEQYPQWEAKDAAMDVLQSMGYDGITHIGGGRVNADGVKHQVYIAFEPEQIKNIDNLKPTSDPDIRYSLSDTEGRELSKEQRKYFSQSKVVDENGNLKVMYHGTPSGKFTVFKDGTYFTENKWYADLYQNPGASSISTGKVATDPKTYEVYLDIKKPFDINDAEARKIYINDYIKGGNAVGINPYLSDAEYAKIRSIDWTEGEDLRDFLVDNGYDYDGLVLDEGAVGGYGEDVTYRGKSYVIFSPEQVKNADNKTPTSDPDIRYSLSEYTAEEKKAHNKAVLEHFGKTYSWAETGYLLLDGTRLDLSGKHDGAPGGYRTVDHRDITEALGYDYGGGDYSGSLVQFMSEGNIRIIPECNGINLSVKPTEAQERALSNYISRYRGEVMLDIDDLNGNTVVSVEYPYGTHYTTVLNDIREWFDNGEKPKNSGSYSLTKEGETPKKYGNYNVYGKDIALETAQDIAPIQETVSEMETVDDIAPMPSETNSYTLRNELEKLETQIREEIVPVVKETNDAAPLTAAMERHNALSNQIRQMEAEEKAETRARLNSLNDEDAPLEKESQYSAKILPPENPFDDRDIADVGNRKVKAYMYENPEVKPFFQEAALDLLSDLRYTVKGERWYTYEGGYGGTSRYTTKDIAYLLDSLGYTYDQIEKGLNAIIEDHGAENNACSKRIEFLLNDRLMKGFQTIEGYEIPANQDYINLLKEKEITEYSEEAYKYFWEHADDYAPPVEDDIAPTAEYEAIKPKPEKLDTLEKQWAKNKMARADKVKGDTEQSQIAQVLDTEPTTESERNQRKWAIFKANVLDKGAVFEDLSLKTKNRKLMGKWNYTLYSDARAQRLMGEGAEGVKSLNAIREEVGNTKQTKQFYEYMYHKHNVDRMKLEERYADTKNKPVFGDSVTAEASQEIVNQYEFAQPEFKRYAQDVYDYMNHLRKLLVDNGVISQETADLWSDMYPHYVPIRRSGETGLDINVPLDTGRTGVNAPIKAATGGNSDILPLFDTIAQRTSQTYKAIAKNSFGIELKNTLGTTVENTATNLDEVFDSIDAQDGLLQDGKNGKNPTFTVFENGERVTFEITKDMYDAMKPLSDSSLLSKTIKPLNVASNFHRGLLTEYNPVFMLTNAVKDIQDVLLNSQHAAKTYAKIPEAYAQMFKKGYWYKEYMENGGEQNTYFDNETNTFKTENKGIAKILDLPPFSTISKINNFIEMTPRLAEYIASREAGASVEVAMLDAARVTTNFKAGGDFTKFLNRNGATFLNASVQGAMQQVRNVREAKANGIKGWLGLATKFAVAGLPALLLNNLVWEDDEDYEELSEYVKDNYYVVAKYGDGNFVRIPKGRMVAVIQDAIEQVSNALTGDDEADFANVIELALNNVAPNNPINNNILAPIMQVINNETWYGEDLVPTRLQDLPASEQFDESTDALSKWLGETLDYSPYKINYLLNQYSGGLGDVVLPMMTPEAESGDNSLLGNIIAPLKDKFTTDSVMNNQNVSDFYETVDKLKVNANSSYATDEDVLKHKYINSVNADLGELYKQKRELQNSNLADDEKYAAVRDIQKQINDLAKNSLNTYGNVNINGEYASIGDRYFKKDEDGEWQKITDKRLEKQEEVTSGLGIDPSEYWSNKTEYDFAYEHPEKYLVAKSVGGYDAYKTYSSELYDIKADKDENGKSISGSRKEKVLEYINNLDADYGEKLILFKSEYNADDTYNYEIIDYLNSREDISYKEMETILKELGFTVKADGTIEW